MPILIALISLFCTALNPETTSHSDAGSTTSVSSTKGTNDGDFILADDIVP